MLDSAVGREKAEDELHFFVEVKTLNVVDGVRRLQDMRDDALDGQVSLEKQIDKGRRFAYTETSIAPYQRWIKGRRQPNEHEYDRFSVRQVIETLIDKCRSAFKRGQFERGPTFALANLLRLPLPGPAGCH